jgi:hypothetical protein
MQVPAGGGTVTVSTEGTTDTIGILYGPDGIEITRDLNAGGNFNFRISRQLSAGMYCVEVQGGSLTTIGAYRLRVAGAVSNIASPLVAAVLPSSRSVQVGTTATAFATIINTGQATVAGCRPTPPADLSVTFTFQTTDPATNQLIGTPNAPIDILAGTAQSFVLALTPTAAFAPSEALLNFTCATTVPATSITGLTTLLLTAAGTPVPDIVALAATLSNNGVVGIAGATGTGVFAVATVNVGTSGPITALADTGGVNLPVTLTLCETSPTTGSCVGPMATSVATQITANATPTFGVFVQGTGTVAFDPAQNRIFVRFMDAQGVTRGSTSVAVRTQ